jgi:hypothetical protein
MALELTAYGLRRSARASPIERVGLPGSARQLSLSLGASEAFAIGQHLLAKVMKNI